MTEEILEQQRYPIGRFYPKSGSSAADRAVWIAQIEVLPAELQMATAGASDAVLETLYREDGWTIRQVIHHVADSHMHDYIRFCYALSVESPTIMPFDPDGWARLPTVRAGAIEPSLRLIAALNDRWIPLLSSLDHTDWRRPLHHPEMGTHDADWILQLCAWHTRHHTAHVRMGIAHTTTRSAGERSG